MEFDKPGSKHARIRSLSDLYHFLSIPLVATYVLDKRYIHPDHRLSWWRRLSLVTRMWRATRRIQTGTSYKAHVAIAAKLLGIPRSVPGVVVECGCWKGGSTVNLSLACRVAGRSLIVYDSFEGLPEVTEGDRYAKPGAQGLFAGSLDLVRSNVEKHGAPEVTEYRKGWFDETLPGHTEPVVLVCADVDFQSSLHDVVVNLWPHLYEQGYFFIDEFMFLDYCGLFWSESFWKKHFDCGPPGLMGSGTGIGLGQYYLGPFDWKVHAMSIAYTRKDFSGHWNYERD